MAGITITKDKFGATADGRDVDRYTLKNKKNVTVQVINLGGIVTSIQVPDKEGKIDDITTGFDSVAEYEKNPPMFGALVGRVANRIHKGKFTLDGQTYELAVNNGPNCLHGGINGFNKKLWKVTEVKKEDNKLKLEYVSPDGEENFPGEVTVNATYELTDDNELIFDYQATTNKPTLVNLTNHAYFNLAGHTSPNQYDHVISINADTFLLKNEDNVPSGEIASVASTLFDLRQPVKIGDRIDKVHESDMGYDTTYCISGSGEKKFTARVEHEASGRVLEVYTNQPAVVFYTANFLENTPGKGGVVYGKHSSFCLETQVHPDAINHPNFPSCVLRPGETYHQRSWYKFSTKS